MAIMEFKQAFSMCTAGFFLILVFMVDPTFQLPIDIETTKDAALTTEIITKNDKTTQTVDNAESSNFRVRDIDSLSSTKKHSGENFCSDKADPCFILLVTFGVVIGLLIIVVFVLIYFLVCRKSSNNASNGMNETESTTEDGAKGKNQPSTSTAVSPLLKGMKRGSKKKQEKGVQTTVCISLVELWELVKLPNKCSETENIREACNALEGYDSKGSGDEEDGLKELKSLYKWKKEHADQIPELFQECRNADMLESLVELTKFQSEHDVTDADLEHILWHIGKQDPENIVTLLNNLNNTSRFSSLMGQSLAGTVKQALPELQKWSRKFFVDTPRTWGGFSINPQVCLSLKIEEFFDKDPELFIASTVVPYEDKLPLSRDDIEKQATLFFAPYEKIKMEITDSQKSHSKGNKGAKGKLEADIVSRTIEMIKDSMEMKECSNYEKRTFLRKAEEEALQDSGATIDTIRGFISSTKNVEAEARTLITEVIAKALGFEKDEVADYAKFE